MLLPNYANICKCGWPVKSKYATCDLCRAKQHLKTVLGKAQKRLRQEEIKRNRAQEKIRAARKLAEK